MQYNYMFNIEVIVSGVVVVVVLDCIILRGVSYILQVFSLTYFISFSKRRPFWSDRDLL